MEKRLDQEFNSIKLKSVAMGVFDCGIHKGVKIRLLKLKGQPCPLDEFDKDQNNDQRK